MFFRSLARASTLFSAVAAALTVLAPVAHAGPPTIGGAATVQLPNIGESVTINLRELGVIAGSAPLLVDGSATQVLVNGTPAGTLVTALFPNNGPGHACIVIGNTDFTFGTGQVFTLSLAVSDLAGNRISGTVPITNIAGPVVDTPAEQAACDDRNTPPIANAGPDQTLNDTDGQPGELVQLDASATTDVDAGNVLTYQWFDLDTDQALGPASSSPLLQVTLGNGAHNISLSVNDDSADFATSSANDQVVITVNAAAAPTANAGTDRNIADSDGQPGESVTLDGSGSTDPDGTIVSYEWFRVLGGDQPNEPLGTGQTITVTLPDGSNTILLRITDNASIVSVDNAVITVAAAPPETILSEIPGLTPNQQRMAQKLDGMCDALGGSEVPLTADQTDLLAKCNGIRVNNTTANQVDALEELIPDDFAVARTQTLLFANTQYVSVMDRLIALRGGAKGLSLAGLNVIVDGKLVPLAQLEEIAHKLFGGGASADEPGGLLSDKWGLWARGNFSFGEKDASAASPAFDADQWAFVGGLDYRLSNTAVVGGALSYGSSSVDFAGADGSLDTDSFAGSLYGSVYAAKNFYFDGIVNVANSSYDANRNITYVDGTGLITADATGDTDGMTLSGGLSMGYDFLLGGMTISPNVGVFYIDTTIDSFTEEGAGGLNLIYDEQKFKSMTGNAGLRLTYAWNVSWGVLLPHLRADYVREFEDDVDVFGVRFAADPNAASTPPVLVATDNPDQSYWRLAAGFSAQFKHGVSGYIEYQRLESFEFIDFQDVSIGLRFQRSF
ncbi:MAG TPA: autotransporter domain-containing protein [Steroidobacteraceae bacterium]|nr:autotransporter domain-containing protein [Steroidobacteraceae bacterium]